jgi:SPX domain protein involved in polyphosphate accumulation
MSSDYRFERKFLISNMSAFEIETYVKRNPQLFTEIFYKRQINNIYFDTIHFSNYMDNVKGSADRTKIRIRWYGDLFGKVENPVLEFKIKKGLMGKKESYSLCSFHLDSRTTHRTLQKTFEMSDIPLVKKELLLQFRPTLLNHYERKYFQSANKKFRITIDDLLTYYEIRNNFNSFNRKVVDKNTTILELKYESDHDKVADKVSGNFPFRLTKSSKYLTGIDFLDLWQ